MEKNKLGLTPKILVFFQFVSLFAIMFSGPVMAGNIWMKGVQLMAVFLGFWAVYVMKIGNFNIAPVPVKNGVFKSSGPYRLIRHPMYTSIFIFVVPELIDQFSYFRLVSFVILLITLLIKMKYEEKRLILHFSQYETYMKQTKRIIPYIF